MKIPEQIKTFALITIVLFFTLQKGGGPLLAILLPFFLITVIFNLIRMVQRPIERKNRGIRLATWSIVFALAGSIQIYWSRASRNEAESALQNVKAYKERTGSYPASFREVGLEDKYLKDKWGLRYSVKEGKPALTYPAPIMPLAVYEYDFEAHKWRENAY